jgi:hypothetical protein
MPSVGLQITDSAPAAAAAGGRIIRTTGTVTRNRRFSPVSVFSRVTFRTRMTI